MEGFFSPPEEFTMLKNKVGVMKNGGGFLSRSMTEVDVPSDSITVQESGVTFSTLQTSLLDPVGLSCTDAESASAVVNTAPDSGIGIPCANVRDLFIISATSIMPDQNSIFVASMKVFFVAESSCVTVVADACWLANSSKMVGSR